MIPRMLSLIEARQILGVSRNTMYELVRTGEVPARKIGDVWRIREDVLDKYTRKVENRK